MRASKIGVHIGCALVGWNPASAFVLPSHVSQVSPSLRRARGHEVLGEKPRSVSTGPIVSASQRVAVGVSNGVQWRSRTRHGWQCRLSMSSNQGMNPESFTERAWDAMVRLPSLADANQAQVPLGWLRAVLRIPIEPAYDIDPSPENISTYGAQQYDSCTS